MSTCFIRWCAFPKLERSIIRLHFYLGCAGLALLSACSGGHHVVIGESTSYYLDHAARNYAPPGPPSDPWGPYIDAAAARFDIPATWIRQVMRVESGGHEYSGGRLIVSSAGAMGLMQLEPATYQEMADKYGLGPDPFNPYDNVMAGTAYIHEMYAIYGSPGFLAAYNAGPGRLDAYMNDHTPLPFETVNYVAMIAPNIQGQYPQNRSEADQLALNTKPMGHRGGLLPAGFDPDAPPSQDASTPLYTPVEVASVAAPPPAASAIYTPPPPISSGSENSPAPEQVAWNAPAPPARSAIYSPEAPSSPALEPGAQQTTASAFNTVPQSAPAIPAEVPLPAPPPPPPHHGFAVIPAAMADSPPRHYAAMVGHTGWAIQVGAYETSSNARAALGIAKLSAVQILSTGRATIESIRAGGKVEYRARFVGLEHDDAVSACNRLARGPTGCVVLSPEAQS